MKESEKGEDEQPATAGLPCADADPDAAQASALAGDDAGLRITFRPNAPPRKLEPSQQGR